jgi:hypothetical protein
MQGLPTRLRRVARISALAVAGSLAATAAASAATPAVTVTPSVGLASGQSVTVAGTGFDVAVDPNGAYVAEGAIVDGVLVYTGAKWIAPTTAPGSAGSSGVMNADGSFSVPFTVASSGSWTVRSGQTVGGVVQTGTRTVDCSVVTCSIITWSAHTPTVAPSFSTSTPLSFGPSTVVTPHSDIPAAGGNLAVTGAGFDPTVNPNGLYVAESAVIAGARLYSSAVKWIAPTTAPGAGGANGTLNTDGTFSTTLDVVASGTFDNGRGGGATTVDCRHAATPCTIYTWAAHTDAIAAWRTTQPLTFLADVVDPGSGGGPAIAVSPTSGLSTAGPTTVSVSGSGFDPVKNEGFGVYVMYGPVGATQQSQFYSAKWVAPGNAPGAGTDTMSSTGTFATTVDVVPSYTDGTGTFVNCTVVQCAVSTIAAHQYGATDRSQDTRQNITFAGAVASQADAPVTAPDLVPEVAPTTAPSTTGTPNAAGPLVGPKVTKVVVGKQGKASLKVSEPSTVTFTVRKKVGKKYVVVKTITVTAKTAGTVNANLKITKKGLYRITMQAKGPNGGTKTVVKSLRVG